MIKPPHPIWRKFERDYIRKQPKGWHANIQTYLDMVDWVIYLGKWPLDEDRLAGIEDDIKLARALNARLPITSGDARSGAQ